MPLVSRQMEMLPNARFVRDLTGFEHTGFEDSLRVAVTEIVKRDPR
jgi:hypothetical protein